VGVVIAAIVWVFATTNRIVDSELLATCLDLALNQALVAIAILYFVSGQSST
jgi:hypothetical protein